MSTSPLKGRKVIEVGTMLAAPFATHILAQLGAEVIKIESPLGDPTRGLVRGGPSGTLIAYSHGKKNVCLDLSKPDGQAALQALLKTADALVHNLAPRAAAKLGLSKEACATINPSLIYCHIRGFGEGPAENDLASNPVAEAATGVMEGNRINGRPSRLGPSYHDQFAGAYAVIGMLASMLDKNPSAQSVVEVGLYETGLHVASRDLVGMQLKTQLLGRPEKEPHGEFSMPGYGAYLTADERWIYLLMLTDAHWAKFCVALQVPAERSQEYARLRDRKKNREDVEALVRDAVIQHSFDEVHSRLKAAGVGCAEVLPLERVLDAPQARHPGKLQDVEFRGLHFDVPQFPCPTLVRQDDSFSPAELGEHTVESLLAAGLSEDQCRALLESGAAHSVDPSRFTWAAVRDKA